MGVDVASWTDAQLDQAVKAVLRATKERALEFYAPYPKQREFHRLGKDHRERLFMAGNQLGKTYSGGAEVAMHLTGRYPAWWEGLKFEDPIHAWAAGVTSESTRDNPQRILMGPPANKGQWGTGAIPKEDIVSYSMARGVSDALDQVVVSHQSGGQSILGFKSYERGREKWQGETLHFIWFDEEPPEDIYSEGQTRLTATRGSSFITATPLLGMSKVIRLFYPRPTTDDRALVRMEMEDAPHISPEDREAEKAKWPEHEREARARGIPLMGEGLVFPVTESSLKVSAFEIPDHFVVIGGMDFGYDHPFAACKLAWDREDDIVYVCQTYRKRKETPVMHCAAIKPWNVVWAWPHDGHVHDKGSGAGLARQYADQGLEMLPHHATLPDGGNSLEASIQEMMDYMLAGRLRVFSHLEDFFEEMRNYHRKDGKIVKEHDDLLSAVRYAFMMRRYAKPVKRRAMKKYPTGYRTNYAVHGALDYPVL